MVADLRGSHPIAELVYDLFDLQYIQVGERVKIDKCCRLLVTEPDTGRGVNTECTRNICPAQPGSCCLFKGIPDAFIPPELRDHTCIQVNDMLACRLEVKEMVEGSDTFNFNL